jgi:PTS system ascorbate-specific IIA component
MAHILLVAHAPMASSLQAVASHAYADCSRQLAAVDVAESASLEQAQAQITAALAAMGDEEVLILVDAFGATPCNAALSVANGVRWRVVTGLNVPMLWRTLCYGQLPLAELVTRAVDGGKQGVMQVTAPRRQQRPDPGPPDDQQRPDQ